MCIADELAPALRRGAQAINGFVCGVFLNRRRPQCHVQLIPIHDEFLASGHVCRCTESYYPILAQDLNYF